MPTDSIHTLRTATRFATLALVLAVFASPTHAQPCAFETATQRFSNLIATQSLDGGALLLGDRNGVLLESYFGAYAPETVVALASATKLLSAIRIAQLAEQGALDLDAPVSTWMPQFQNEKAAMTVAQMFSHTSGYGDDSASLVVLAPGITLAEAVDTIACCIPMPNGWLPDAQFAYGGISMHIAGRVAEIVGGGDWQAQWQTHLAVPLGASTIDYQAFNPGTNYGIGGSARANLRDYGKLLHLLLNQGRSQGQRLLFPTSVEALFRDRIGTRPVAYAPGNATPPIRYGLGNWLDPTRSGAGDAFGHSLGLFGAFPFVDFREDLFGLFLIKGPAGINDAALPVYTAMLQDIATQRSTQQCTHIETFDDIGGDGFESPRTVL